MASYKKITCYVCAQRSQCRHRGKKKNQVFTAHSFGNTVLLIRVALKKQKRLPKRLGPITIAIVDKLKKLDLKF